MNRKKKKSVEEFRGLPLPLLGDFSEFNYKVESRGRKRKLVGPVKKRYLTDAELKKKYPLATLPYVYSNRFELSEDNTKLFNLWTREIWEQDALARELRGRKRRMIGPVEGWEILTKKKNSYLNFTNFGEALKNFDESIEGLLNILKKGRLADKKIKVFKDVLTEYSRRLKKMKEEKKALVVKGLIFILKLWSKMKLRWKEERKEALYRENIVLGIVRELGLNREVRRILFTKKHKRKKRVLSKRALYKRLIKLRDEKEWMINYFLNSCVLVIIGSYYQIELDRVEDPRDYSGMLLNVLNVNSYLYFFYMYYLEYIVVNYKYSKLYKSYLLEKDFINYYNLNALAGMEFFKPLSSIEGDLCGIEWRRALSRKLNKFVRNFESVHKCVDPYRFDPLMNKPNYFVFFFFELSLLSVDISSFSSLFFSYAEKNIDSNIVPYSQFGFKWPYSLGVSHFNYLTHAKMHFYRLYLQNHSFFTRVPNLATIRRFLIKYLIMRGSPNRQLDGYYKQWLWQRYRFDHFIYNKNVELRQGVVEYMKDVIRLDVDKDLYNQVKNHPYISLLLKTYLTYSGVFEEAKFYNGISIDFYNVNVNRYMEGKRKLIMSKFLEKEYRGVSVSLLNEAGKGEWDLKHPHIVLHNKQMYMKYMLFDYWKFDSMLMGLVYKERLVHYYFFNSFMKSSKNCRVVKSVKMNIVYSRVLFLSYFFLDKTLVVLLDQQNPGLLLRELLEVEGDNYDLCMHLVIRVFESLDNLGMFLTFVLSGFIFDCLTLNNTRLLNDSIFSLKEFGVGNHMALNFGRYNTLVWNDDLDYVAVNKSLDEFKFRRNKEQLFSWYVLCNNKNINRKMLMQVDTLLEFFKDLVLHYMMSHKDLDFFFFFLEKDMKRKEWIVEDYYNKVSKRNSFRYLWIRTLMWYELNELKGGRKSLIFEKHCYKYLQVRY